MVPMARREKEGRRRNDDKVILATPSWEGVSSYSSKESDDGDVDGWRLVERWKASMKGFG